MRIVIPVGLLMFCIILGAQDKQHELNLGFGFAAGSQKTLPFWLLSNQYSLLEKKPFNIYSSVDYHKNFIPNKKLDFSYGINLINKYSDNYHIYPEELYARIKYEAFQFQAGRVKEIFSNENTNLSSGGLLWSGNALPLPSVSVSIPEYYNIAVFKNLISVKGGIYHGIFDNNQFVKRAFLHHKYLSIKILDDHIIGFSLGLHHYAQWAGISKNPLIGQIPCSLREYLRIFIASPGGKSSHENDQLNVAGNHLGTYNLNIDLNLKAMKADFYWQSIFEDKSGMRVNNFMDGLYGFSFMFKNYSIIDNILIEILSTTNQSGRPDPDSDPSDPQPPSANDNYFNHWLYNMGWSYMNMGIGNPLITSPALSNFKNDVEYFNNNRVRAFHTAFSGKTNYIKYKILFSYSLNYGTYNFPFLQLKKQTSLLFNIMFPELFINTDFNIAFGFDKGDLYKNSMGFHLSFLRKVF